METGKPRPTDTLRMWIQSYWGRSFPEYESLMLRLDALDARFAEQETEIKRLRQQRDALIALAWAEGSLAMESPEDGEEPSDRWAKAHDRLMEVKKRCREVGISTFLPHAHGIGA